MWDKPLAMSENGYSTLEIRVRAVDAVLRGQGKGEVANAFGATRRTFSPAFTWTKDWG